MNKRLIVGVIVIPLLAGLGTALFIGILYPLGWPEQAAKADDSIGYWMGSLGIPAVAVVVLLIERRKLNRPNP